MSVEDKRIGRLIARELHRFTSLDVSEVEIRVFHGTGYLGGTFRPATGLFSLNMKEELRIVVESSRKIPGLRSLVIDAKVETVPLR